MEVNVKVTVELGAQTLAVLTGLNAKAAPEAAKTPTPENAPQLFPSGEDQKRAADEAGRISQETEKKTRTRRTAAEIAAEKAAAVEETPAAKDPEPVAEKKPLEFEDLDEAAQLEAIKAEVTRHTKKGKSADIKALLAFHEAGRASELAAEQYPGFYDMVKRYAAGESVNDLTSLD